MVPKSGNRFSGKDQEKGSWITIAFASSGLASFVQACACTSIPFSAKGNAMLSTLVSYQLISSNMTRSLNQVSSEPAVKRESDYYLANIGKVTSIDDFMNNDRLYNYAMQAFGLGDMAYAKGFIRKVLTEGITSSSALANQLTDPRYKALATTFDFTDFGASTTSTTAAQQGVVDQYAQQQLETEAGNQNTGVQLALYFARKASGLSNGYQVLADKALTKVVQTVLGWSDSALTSNIDQLASTIESKIDLKSLSDPTKLNKFLDQFAVMYDMQNQQTSTPVPTLAIGQPLQMGFSSDLMAAIQGFKPGGA
jgi:hypothetical protein